MKKPGAWPDSLPIVGDLSSPWAVLDLLIAGGPL